MQGDLYEHMLVKLNSAGRLGAFRTPKQTKGLMVNLMQPIVAIFICENDIPDIIQRFHNLEEEGEKQDKEE